MYNEISKDKKFFQMMEDALTDPDNYNLSTYRIVESILENDYNMDWSPERDKLVDRLGTSSASPR